MTLGDLILGLLVALGFFVSALVSRMFRRPMAGIFIGGVAGLAVSVFILVYGLTDVFSIAPPAAEN
jgi:hypothetical protein